MSTLSTVIRGRTGKHREKVWCPGCRQVKNALWRRPVGGEQPQLVWSSHRVQVDLAPGEKPVRCEQSGQPVAKLGVHA